MSRIIIIIIWSKSQVPLYMRAIKWGDVNYAFFIFIKFYYVDIGEQFWFYTRTLDALPTTTAKVPTDFIIIFRVEEKERYVLWPKYFPHRERTLTINSTSTLKGTNIYRIFSRVYLYQRKTGTFREVFRDDTMRPMEETMYVLKRDYSFH